MMRPRLFFARSGSRDFSYLVLASVRTACLCAERRTLVASKVADSHMTFFVVSDTALS